ncbi:MAG: hypothetical protein KF773_22005 [Deltaproteobacteria bacterium]|nr:hypothetical protein [Deltaproteobacteria bacterium]MCW5807293.1 hypothetical protein [Deltaproteobacteria bacterium]
MEILILGAIVLAVAWWWIGRAPVSPPRVPMMASRIAFPSGLKLADPAAAVARLVDPDEIVIPFERATLVIEYPLTAPARVEIVSPVEHGFTRAELVRAICEEYATIYEAEEATAASTPTVPPAERSGRGDRNRTDGLYGIWGHDLEDLVLTASHWARRSDGTVTVSVHVESTRSLAP